MSADSGLSDTQWNVLSESCPSRTSLARIANKWTAMIVIVLTDGPQRFGAIQQTVQGISGKVLTDTLRALERDGILTRHSYPENPPRVEYELTALGRTLTEPPPRWGGGPRSTSTRSWPPGTAATSRTTR
ncbi:winged helix-turn-helix transcriptional regulator [Micrococcus terreus]|uniref:Transcriptional regulator, HxlR family n=1 Tax=Micrococcus terreus TaxID=574650 RepID=A0A1I7ME19_9MICC|nr:helix-turn-helix domain-containing protein [Micrococcus terreus]SFV20171.1 transcriptional regulator, HxlR family [Micrococcus terreus]